MKCRNLLSLLAAGSASAALAGGWRGGKAGSRQVLLLLELRGGNDGLNTMAPLRDPAYREARPSLALEVALPLTAGLALHPALSPLLPLWGKATAWSLPSAWAGPGPTAATSRRQTSGPPPRQRVRARAGSPPPLINAGPPSRWWPWARLAPRPWRAARCWLCSSPPPSCAAGWPPHWSPSAPIPCCGACWSWSWPAAGSCSVCASSWRPCRWGLRFPGAASASRWRWPCA
jgi:hypothetical protein